jgi:hypothetical protein
MLKWDSAQGAPEAPEGDARTEQIDLLKDFILEEYYPPEDIEGWDPSEMERPDRKTVMRLIRFFLNEA